MNRAVAQRHPTETWRLVVRVPLSLAAPGLTAVGSLAGVVALLLGCVYSWLIWVLGVGGF